MTPMLLYVQLNTDRKYKPMNYKQYNVYEIYASRELHLSYKYVIAQTYLLNVGLCARKHKFLTLSLII
jgi:hypothetical protein